MADAQFVIDIAANMTGGKQTADELDELTRELMGGGKNADFFQQAIAEVARELSGAQAAAKAANAALAAGEAEYARLETAALQVAKAAEKAAQKNGGIMPPEAAAFVQAGNAALAEQAARLKDLEAAAKGATSEEKRLASTAANLETLNGHVNKSLAEQGEHFEKLRGALENSGGALGHVASKALAPVQSFAKLASTMGAARAAALILSAAVVALTTAVLAAGVATVAWGIGMADAGRSFDLTQDAVRALHPELAALDGTMTALTAQTGLHADALDDLALKLKQAHVAAKDMPGALQAAALAEAALGKGGSQQFFDQLAQGRKTVAQLTTEFQTKLGPIVAKQMLSLTAQGARLHDEVQGLFDGINIDGFLGELSNVVGDLDSSTELGKQLKLTFQALFQPLVDGATKGVVAIEAFVLRAAILAVRAYIAFKPYTGIIKDVGLAFAVAAGVFATTFVPAALSAAAALLGVIATAALAAAPFLAIGAAVVAAYEAFTHWDQVKSFMATLPAQFNQFAANMVLGFVNGIASGASAITGAIGDAFSGALNAGKKLLGIASPSKVFAELGGYTVQGYAQGVDREAPDAQAAVANAVAPPSPADAAAAGAGAVSSPADAPAKAAPAAASKGGDRNVSGNTFIFNGVKDAEDALDKFAEMLTRVVEGDALQMGAPAPAGA